MSRPVRIEFPGATYHVTSKGKNGQAVFKDEEDKGVFLNIVGSVVERFGWLLHTYVLMDDHYHLVIEIPSANLSKGMRQLNGVYTQHANRRHGQEGPLFHGRFKSVLFEKRKYLLPVCRHVVANPARVNGVKGFAAYRWSSYRALAGRARKLPCLHTDEILGSFGKREKHSQRKYSEYVKEGLAAPSPLRNRTSQVLLGSPRFVNEMKPILLGEALARRGPKAARQKRTLNALFKGVSHKTRRERNDLIKKAHLDHGYTLMEIGGHLGLHYTTVSKVINA